MLQTHKTSREISSPGSFRRLKFWVWFKERVHPSELQVTVVWAGVIGFLGALCSSSFRVATGFVDKTLTGRFSLSAFQLFSFHDHSDPRTMR